MRRMARRSSAALVLVWCDTFSWFYIMLTIGSIAMMRRLVDNYSQIYAMLCRKQTAWSNTNNVLTKNLLDHCLINNPLSRLVSVANSHVFKWRLRISHDFEVQDSTAYGAYGATGWCDCESGHFKGNKDMMPILYMPCNQVQVMYLKSSLRHFSVSSDYMFLRAAEEWQSVGDFQINV